MDRTYQLQAPNTSLAFQLQMIARMHMQLVLKSRTLQHPKSRQTVARAIKHLSP